LLIYSPALSNQYIQFFPSWRRYGPDIHLCARKEGFRTRLACDMAPMSRTDGLFSSSLVRQLLTWTRPSNINTQWTRPALKRLVYSVLGIHTHTPFRTVRNQVMGATADYSRPVSTSTCPSTFLFMTENCSSNVCSVALWMLLRLS
jgi:hypothetical protein